MTANNSETPKHKRRWFQFSLRTLLAVMLLSTLPMAWYGKQWREHQAEQRAVEAEMNSPRFAIFASWRWKSFPGIGLMIVSLAGAAGWFLFADLKIFSHRFAIFAPLR